MQEFKKITVFTPTYNRGYIIEQLYAALLRQSCMDFEWLVVDDGSSDNTAELFADWVARDNPFSIRYYQKENGGKHRAINEGARLAWGELFFIVDSDDYVTDDAVDTILRQVYSIPDLVRENLAGICNLRGCPNGAVLGTTFEGEYLDCTSLERRKFGIDGDKAEVFFTDVLRKYPFPEFKGEKFVTEAVVWDAMAMDGYLLRYYNKVTYICEYLDDGLTKMGLELYYRNPLGYAHYLRQCRKNGKFEKNVQNYFAVECYLHWRTEMGLRKVAQLLDVNPVSLQIRTLCYQVRQTLGKWKRTAIGAVQKVMGK